MSERVMTGGMSMFPGFFRPVQLEPSDEVAILVNCTPHSIRFRDRDGAEVEVQASGYTLRAVPIEVEAGGRDGVQLVCRTFVASMEGERELAEIEVRPRHLAIGSIISAQTWPGRVYGLVPVEGYERMPPAERLYRCDKFTVFPEQDGPKRLQVEDLMVLYDIENGDVRLLGVIRDGDSLPLSEGGFATLARIDGSRILFEKQGWPHEVFDRLLTLHLRGRHQFGYAIPQWSSLGEEVQQNWLTPITDTF